MEQQLDIRHEYLDKGYIVLKSFYDKKKIRDIRTLIIDLANKDNEIFNNLIVQDLLLNKELITKIKTLLKTNELLYYSDSSILNKENPGVISLVNPEDKDALKDALVQLLNNSDSNFNVNARIYAEKYLNKNQIINSFIKEISILKNTNTV